MARNVAVVLAEHHDAERTRRELTDRGKRVRSDAIDLSAGAAEARGHRSRPKGSEGLTAGSYGEPGGFGAHTPMKQLLPGAQSTGV